MIKIGITGGIGSGKSVVASLLNLYGVPVYVADTESKLLTDTSPVIKEKLTALLGEDLYTEKGLNKKCDHTPRSEPSFFSMDKKSGIRYMCHRIGYTLRIGFQRSGRQEPDGICAHATPYRTGGSERQYPAGRNRTPHQQPVAGRGKKRPVRLCYLQRR